MQALKAAATTALLTQTSRKFDMGHNKWLKNLIIIIVLGALLLTGLMAFGKCANDDLGSYDGGRGEYADEIENG